MANITGIIVDQLSSKDVKQRLMGIAQLQEFIISPNNHVDEYQLGPLSDSLMGCIRDNNMKISQGALDSVCAIASRYGPIMQPHLHALIPVVAEKMGDTKETVREKVLQVINMSYEVLGPAATIEKITPCFRDKNWRTREQTLRCLLIGIEAHSSVIPIESILTEHVVRLLEDAQQGVRDAALSCLEGAYRVIGASIVDLVLRQNLRPAIAGLVSDKFSTVVPPPSKLHTSAPSIPNPASTSSSASSTLRPRSNSESLSPKQAKGGGTLGRGGNARTLGGYFAADGSKIVPIKITSERELIKELDEISDTLRSLEIEWSIRAKYMHRLQAMIHGGVTDNAAFVPVLLSKMKEPLGVQASDLRSAIAKEACHTITLMSVKLGDAFESLADHYIEVLLKLVFVTIQVIAESANRCIREVIANTRVNRGISKLMECATGKSGILRGKSMEYLHLILRLYPTSILDRFVDGIESTIRHAVSDAVQEARTAGRQCYRAYAVHYEARAARLLNSMDPQTRRLVVEEGQRENGEKIEKSSLPRPSSAPLRKPFPKPNTIDSFIFAAPTAPNVPVEVVFGKTFPPASTIKRTPYSNEPPTNPAPGGSSFTIPSSPSPPQSPPSTSSAPTLPPSKKLGGAMRVAETPKDDFASIIMNYPSSSSSSNNITNGSGGGLNNSGGTAKRVPAPAAAPPPATSTIPDSKSSSAIRVPVVESSEFAGNSHGLEELSKIMLDAESSLWSTRVECFQSLRRVIRAPERAHDLTVQFARVMKMLLDHVQDPHAKVARSALEAIREMLVVYPAASEPYLERLLPLLFGKLASNKDEIRLQSSVILESMMDCFSADLLCTILMKIIEQQNSKLKIGILEYFVHLIADATGFFGNTAQMRSCLTKVLACAGITPIVASAPNPTNASSLDLKRAVLQCIISIYTHHKLAFLGQLQNMPINVQLECRRMVSPHIPAIDAELTFGPRAFTAPTATAPSSTVAVSGRSKPISPTPSYFDNDSITLQDAAAIHLEPTPTTVQAATPKSKRQQSTRSFPDQLHHESDQSTIKSTTTTTNINTNNNGITESRPNQIVLPRPSSKKKDMDIHTILDNLATPSGRTAGLHSLIKVSRDGLPSIWTPNFDLILAAVFDCLSDERGAIRELSLLVVKEMLVNQTTSFVEFHGLISDILVGFSDGEKGVLQASEEVMDVLVAHLPPQPCLNVLIDFVRKKDGAELHASIRFLARLCYRIPPASLVRQLPIILPGVFDGFKHQNADVRKAVVFCLVDIYLVLGDDLIPYLAPLSVSQKKLVTLYVNRAKAKLNGTAGGPINSTGEYFDASS